MRKFGETHGYCPYFLARRVISVANVVVYSYQYLIDPKVSGLVSAELSRDCIVIFDEAHNIDSVCIEALSVNLDTAVLNRSIMNLSDLQRRLKEFRTANESRLRDEYQRLREGLAAAGFGQADEIRHNPVLPPDILQEAVPGNIRRGEHFLMFMRRFVEYVRDRLRVNIVVHETPSSFVQGLEQKMQVDARALRFCSDRLRSLFHTMKIPDIDRFLPLRVVADFATLMGTYDKGFSIIIEPYDERAPTVHNPVLQFSCLDAAIAMRVVFQKFDSVIITSGTLTPLDMYPRILSFTAAVTASFPMTLTRRCVCPMIVSKGNDQTQISSQFAQRAEPSVIRNYGNLLLDVCSAVPDGVICFFTSYSYMEQIVAAWNEQQILRQLSEHKLIFIETPDTLETAVALENYRKACDSGRGAVLLSIARGKVAEGIDFDGHYGRAVVMLGVPYMYTESRVLRARMKFMSDNYHISEEDFLTFDAMRQAAQCIGRVIRNKSDYGLMVLADRRYRRSDKRNKLPKWINEFLEDSNLDLSTDLAVQVAKRFLKEMAHAGNAVQLGVSLWDQGTVDRISQQMREQGMAALGYEQKPELQSKP
jgi:DNA excision repair protein ERCC-2